jgi:hypothetical protein
MATQVGSINKIQQKFRLIVLNYLSHAGKSANRFQADAAHRFRTAISRVPGAMVIQVIPCAAVQSRLP